MIIQGFSNSMIFPCMELFLVIFQVFHDFQSLWKPCITVDYISNVHVRKLFERKIVIIFLSITLNIFRHETQTICFVCLFCFFMSQSTAMVIGGGGMVSSPNHTISCVNKLEQALNQYIPSLVADNNLS